MRYSLEQLSSTPFTFHHCEIDAKRGLIIKQDEEIAIEPKVMAVLLYLIANAEQVVDQETLFSHVWPRSVFSPNSLRRCISTLRKVFADENKALITTHPKLGYSINALPGFDKPKPSTLILLSTKQTVAVASICILIFISAFLFAFGKTEHSEINIAEMTPITATDILEDFIALSPNGLHIAFTRFESGNIKNSEVWIRNNVTGEEKQLSIANAHIRNLSWSNDGANILFVEVTSKGWQIKQASFNQNHDISTIETLLTDNHQAWISSVHKSGDDKLYFVSNHEGQAKLYRYHLATKNLISVTLNNAFTPYELTIVGDVIALTGQNDHREAIVSLVNVKDHKILESHHLTVKERFSISWIKGKEKYLLNNGRRLFSLGKNGKLDKVNFENSHFIRFAKATGNTLYLVSGNLDHDIQLFDESSARAKTIFDSTAMDYFPSISPDNQKIAFYSTRFGKPQLFLYDYQKQKSQLIFENVDEHLSADRTTWSETGRMLAFSMGENVYTITLDNDKQHLHYQTNLQGRVIAWYPDETSLLVMQIVNGQKRLIKYNISLEQQQVVTTGNFNHIALSTAGEIYVTSKNQISMLTDGKFKVQTSFEKGINRIIPTSNGMYINFKQDKNSWQFWSYESNSLITELAFNSDKNIASISRDGSIKLTSKERRQRDIIKLALK